LALLATGSVGAAAGLAAHLDNGCMGGRRENDERELAN
jgi:hypothetical protein